MFYETGPTFALDFPRECGGFVLRQILIAEKIENFAGRLGQGRNLGMEFGQGLQAGRVVYRVGLVEFGDSFVQRSRLDDQFLRSEVVASQVDQ